MEEVVVMSSELKESSRIFDILIRFLQRYIRLSEFKQAFQPKNFSKTLKNSSEFQKLFRILALKNSKICARRALYML